MSDCADRPTCRPWCTQHREVHVGRGCVADVCATEPAVIDGVYFVLSDATQIEVCGEVRDVFPDAESHPSIGIYWEGDSLSLTPAQAVAMARDLLSVVSVLPAQAVPR